MCVFACVELWLCVCVCVRAGAHIKEEVVKLQGHVHSCLPLTAIPLYTPIHNNWDTPNLLHTPFHKIWTRPTVCKIPFYSLRLATVLDNIFVTILADL